MCFNFLLAPQSCALPCYVCNTYHYAEALFNSRIFGGFRSVYTGHFSIHSCVRTPGSRCCDHLPQRILFQSEIRTERTVSLKHEGRARLNVKVIREGKNLKEEKLRGSAVALSRHA